jgi:cytosine/adenosine deaminase-related metal-dependent hydrolase
MEFDLLIRDARTRLSQGELLDIGIKNSRILRMGKISGKKATHTLNAEGKLVTESFVNGHLHLCKVYTLTRVGEDALSSYTSGTMGGAMTAIEQAARVKAHYDEHWIIKNVRRALTLGIKEFELKEGNRANLVVLNAESVWEAIWSHEAPLYVIRDGRDITLKQEETRVASTNKQMP